MTEIVLLGTGSADGWPNPFCTCASCHDARLSGQVRGQTAALVDDVLLLDCGPEAPRAALRAGRSLAGVRHVLLTHAHPDHVGPAALLWRSWAQRREPWEVLGSPTALDACRDWIGPQDPVRLIQVHAGERHRVGAYDVRVLAAAHGGPVEGPGLLFEVTGPDGVRVLYATDTGPLPAATLDALTAPESPLDLLLLEETFGDVTGHGTDHLDLATFPGTLAALRERGVVGPGTDVVAIHLGHRNPPTPELTRRLAPWGARVVPDGTALRAGAGRTVQSARPRPAAAGHRVLLLGGVRSGKSAEAERRLAAEPAVTYVATGPAPDDPARVGDPEWAARVAAHRARRPPGWTTLETDELVPLLTAPPGGVPLLVDDLGLWLTARLDATEWASGASIDEPVAALVRAWRETTARVVAVSNEVGAGVHPATAVGRRFRDELGRLNAALAAESDEVWLLTAGIARRLR